MLSSLKSVCQRPKALAPRNARRSLVCRAEEEKADAPAAAAEEAPKAPVVKREIPEARGILGIGGSTAAAAYVDAALPGNWGFDPLGISDPEGAGGAIDPEWLGYAEIIHGRWAMLGVAGAVAPEILGNAGIIPKQTGLLWFQAGVIPPLGSPDFYWADAKTIFFVQIVLMQFAELRRLQDYRNPGSMGPDGQDFAGLQKYLGGSGEAAYPGGGVFNFMKFGKTPEELASMKEKEIKHGRLAMMAFLGIGGQAVITGQGPVQNLVDHLSDPQHSNMWYNFASMNQ
ncbi:chlorophyll A B [Pycnococcus provasolii]|uniref:Chlorophyll a-b binding protein, chloroplastic n=1 Tax=Pycnococcus provasolii TaxID=41880 RepID=A0A830H590_9CHLO|nr:chlorophyll A B [Pycnococcus provasolii]